MTKDDMNEMATFGLIALVIGIWFGYGIGNYFFHRQAIQQECAHYDGKTGEFKWGQVQ